MSILTGRLPDSVEIGGAVYLLRTDYRVSIQFEELMLHRELPGEEKLRAALDLYYEDIPPDSGAALEAAVAFYRCGKDSAPSTTGKRLYSFAHDESYLFAAFLEQYGLSLAEAELHWWKFRALLDALSPDTLFVKIMGWRGMRIDGKLPAYEKKRLQDLKRMYALPAPPVSEETDKLEQILMNGGNIAGLLK